MAENILDKLAERINADMVIFQRLEVPCRIAQLRTHVTEHHAATKSPLAERILPELDREHGQPLAGRTQGDAGSAGGAGAGVAGRREH